MAVLRRLGGSDPNIEVADEQRAGDALVPLHFDPRQPKAALSIEQDTRSVVVSDNPVMKNANLGDPSDVTQVTRARGIAKWFTVSHWVILFESNWVIIVVGLSAVALLICAIRLRQM